MKIQIMNKKSRSCSTDCSGNNFNRNLINYVWGKRTPHPWGIGWGYDRFGNLIKYDDYGKVSKRYGWDIDHSNPVSNGGSDHGNNLQPLQSYYNRYIKADNYPWTLGHHLVYPTNLPSSLKF